MSAVVGPAAGGRATVGALRAALWQRQPLLAALGWAALALLAAALLAMAVDPRTIRGVSVWAKPAKFAASFVLWFWTLAWAWGVLEPAARQGLPARLVLWGTAGAAVFELAWITWRAALGQPSHFAQDPLGGPMYALMGVAAVLLVALAALLGVLVLFRGGAARPAWRLAVGLGLLLGGVLGGIAGATISSRGGPVVGSAGPGLPLLGWSVAGGDLRIAHFLGIHAMQALPALALLAPRAGPGAILLGALAWVALTALAYGVALAGSPPWPWPWP